MPRAVVPVPPVRNACLRLALVAVLALALALGRRPRWSWRSSRRFPATRRWPPLHLDLGLLDELVRLLGARFYAA
eukprot:1480188-Heterocapsa_arctica.AAC.1